MKQLTFKSEQSCPVCNGRFSSAVQKTEFLPVVVFDCPHCRQALWQPGLEPGGQIFPFEPDAEAEGF